MAGNLLPLLLVGGAAAYVVTSQKKKTEEAECPPTNEVTFGQMATASKKVQLKFKKGADPSAPANEAAIVPAKTPRSSSRWTLETVTRPKPSR